MIQLQFLAGSENWVRNICHQKSATVRILSVKSVEKQKDSVTHFVDISSDIATADDLTDDIRKNSEVTESDLARVGSNRVIGAVTSKQCLVCSALVETNTNCFIAPAVTGEDCQMSYKLFVSGSGLPVFLQNLHQRGVLYKISDLSPLATKKGITARQEQVLKSALELGYYDYPKRINSEELSEILKIKPSTLVEILRRAEKSVIAGYFGTEKNPRH